MPDSRPATGYPASLAGKIFALLPEGAIFVFLIVCVIAVVRADGPYVYLMWLGPMFGANVVAIRRYLHRAG